MAPRADASRILISGPRVMTFLLHCNTNVLPSVNSKIKAARWRKLSVLKRRAFTILVSEN